MLYHCGTAPPENSYLDHVSYTIFDTIENDKRVSRADKVKEYAAYTYPEGDSFVEKKDLTCDSSIIKDGDNTISFIDNEVILNITKKGPDSPVNWNYIAN